MTFTESDIKFEKINWKQFEELCYDILHKYQFHSLSWRQGGGDKGRDIEALFTVINPIITSYTEKWFIECKHYSKGIPIEQISGKLDWAVAEKVQHFVLMTNSYPSIATAEYIEKRQRELNFKVHIIDGKLLKQKLLVFPDLVVKYFADDAVVLIQGMLRQWLSHDILPDIVALYKISKLIDARALNIEELTFLFFAFESCDYEDAITFGDLDIEEFSFDFLIPTIVAHTNSKFPIKKPKDLNFDSRIYFLGGGTSTVTTQETDHLTWHYLNLIENNRMIDIIMVRKNKQINVLISTGTIISFKRYKYSAPKFNFSIKNLQKDNDIENNMI
ncbi:restriction endonuclease [Sphingobacterium sp. UDSM-2020]|uniref:restriction endonuclease n=1 Tax=Sphingobacterium sp. UDSM-2020 TaxID=2795738 RepID=UPI001934D4FC|nr:restriction endonuclease [Sphingobacterium sp. UDSM-2020]QQD13144.1 restriction endonuclease [Sphingobacterium sp. UDSM-2020]